jgi:hypothetical protein
MIDTTTTPQEREKRLLFWELAMARKLRDTAYRERRFDDVNYYEKQLLSAEIRAKRLLGIEWRKEDKR